jgi:glutamate carboxypeptidase
MSYKEIFKDIDGMFQRYVDFWVEVSNEESPTNYKEGVDRVGRIFIREAERLGFSVEVHHEEISGDALCITMNPEAKGEPIVFSGHIDTVHPVGSFGTPATKIVDGRIYGPGVTDCKGGCVASLFAMELLKKHGYSKRPVKLVLQSDEEIGSETSCKRTVDFMEKCSKGAIAFLNTEPAVNHKITVARKGIMRFEFNITGIAVHSGACYDGANAVTEAAHKIIELEKFKDKDGITCNCSVIRGGTTSNSVPDQCSFLADVRYKTKAEAENFQKFVTELAAKSFVEGTKTDIRLKSMRVSMELNEKTDALADKIAAIALDAGLGTYAKNLSNGGADSADMVSRGIVAVDSLGVMGSWLHSVKEYAIVDSLKDAVKLLVAAAEEL